MSSTNSGALKWMSHGEKNRRFAYGFRRDTSYVLVKEEYKAGMGWRWSAWFRDHSATTDDVFLGRGNFIQARAKAIVHHHEQKKA